MLEPSLIYVMVCYMVDLLYVHIGHAMPPIGFYFFERDRVTHASCPQYNVLFISFFDDFLSYKPSTFDFAISRSLLR